MKKKIGGRACFLPLASPHGNDLYDYQLYSNDKLTYQFYTYMEGEVQVTGQKSFLIKVTLEKEFNAKYTELYDHHPRSLHKKEDYITKDFDVQLITNEIKQLWLYERKMDPKDQYQNQYAGEQVNNQAHFYNPELNSQKYQGLITVIRFQNKQNRNFLTFKANLPYIVVKSKYMNEGYQLQVGDQINFGRSSAIVSKLDHSTSGTPSFTLMAQCEPTEEAIQKFQVNPNNGLILGRDSEAQTFKIKQQLPKDAKYTMFKDVTVSREHAKVEYINSQFWINDYKQSTFGTLIRYKNNTEIQISEKPMGIQIGTILLEIKSF